MQLFTFPRASIAALLLAAGSLNAQDYSSLIGEDYLRDTFSITDNTPLKYSDCEEQTFLTCSYIWGAPAENDAQRIAVGLKPEGAKLMVIYAQTRGPSDWARVTGVYRDAENIDQLGEVAVWSEQRQQLSVMTAGFLVIHINLDGIDGGRDTAIAVARHVLANL